MRLYHRVIWLSQLIEEPSISVSSGLSSKAGHILWRRLIHPPSWEPGTGLPVPLIGEKGAGSLNLQCGNFHLSLFSADTPTLSLAWHHPETWSICACCPVGVKVSAWSSGMQGGFGGLIVFIDWLAKPPAFRIFPDQGWNPGLAVKAPSPNPWTARQFPGVTAFW